MGIAVLGVAGPFLGLLLNVFFQILSFRIYFKKDLLKSIVYGFCSGGICLGYLEVVWGPKVGGSMADMATYILLSYGYFHFLNLTETARRIRILRELKEAAPDGLTRVQILERYSAEEILGKRLGRLVKNGQIVCRDERYSIGKPIILFAAKTILFFKKMLLSPRA
jgi:hypothetical protein